MTYTGKESKKELIYVELIHFALQQKLTQHCKSGMGLENDPDAPATQLARALLRARLDLAALAAQLVPAPAPAAALRLRPPVYDDGPTGSDGEDAGDETPDLDPELLRYLHEGWSGGGCHHPGRKGPRS